MLKKYAIDLRSHLICIVIDIMKKLLLVNHGIFFVSWKEEVGSERRGTCVDEFKAFPYVTRGYSIVNRES